MQCAVFGVMSVTAGGTDPVTNSVPHQELELRVKAGFLFTFAKYVNWPADAFVASSNTVVIGVVGRDPFGTVLDAAVAGKLVNGLPVRIERYAEWKDVGVCQVLFVAEPGKDPMGKPGVLTVSDAEGFVRRGGHIQLVVEQGRVRFDVNLRAVKQAGLQLDANLLRVARRVDQRAPQPEGK